jgi:hypothetical protein
MELEQKEYGSSADTVEDIQEQDNNGVDTTLFSEACSVNPNKHSGNTSQTQAEKEVDKNSNPFFDDQDTNNLGQGDSQQMMTEKKRKHETDQEPSDCMLREGARNVPVTHRPRLDWSSLPDVILISVFSQLSALDRITAAEVCRHWQSVCDSAHVWWNFEYGGGLPVDGMENDINYKERHATYLQIIHKHGTRFRSVDIVVSTDLALEVLKALMTNCQSLERVAVYSDDEYHHDDPRFHLNFRQTLYMFFSTCCTGLKELSLYNINFLAGRDRHREPIPLGPAHAKTLRILRMIHSLRQNNPISLSYLVNLTDITISLQQLVCSVCVCVCALHDSTDYHAQVQVVPHTASSVSILCL